MCRRFNTRPQAPRAAKDLSLAGLGAHSNEMFQPTLLWESSYGMEFPHGLEKS